MTTYARTITEVSVHDPNENPIFGESATHVKLADEGGGIYLKITQCNDDIEPGEVTFNCLEHLTAVYEAAKEMYEGILDVHA